MKAEFFFGFLSFRKNILTLPLKLLKAETKKKLLSIINQLQSGKLWTWVSPNRRPWNLAERPRRELWSKDGACSRVSVLLTSEITVEVPVKRSG